MIFYQKKKKLHISNLSKKKNYIYIDRSDSNELKTYNYTLIHVIDIDISNKLIHLKFAKVIGVFKNILSAKSKLRKLIP